MEERFSGWLRLGCGLALFVLPIWITVSALLIQADYQTWNTAPYQALVEGTLWGAAFTFVTFCGLGLAMAVAVVIRNRLQAWRMRVDKRRYARLLGGPVVLKEESWAKPAQKKLDVEAHSEP